MTHLGDLAVQLLACPSCGQPRGEPCVTRSEVAAETHVPRFEPVATAFGEGYGEAETWWEQEMRKAFSVRVVCPVHDMPDCSPLLNGCSLVNHLTRYRDDLAGNWPWLRLLEGSQS